MKQLWLKLAVLAVSVLVGLGLAEGMLRYLEHKENSRPQIIRLDEHGLKLHEPNLDMAFFTKESGKESHVVTNAEGFIGRDHSIEAASGTTRIAFLGDSFTESIYVDYEKNFVSLLERQIAEHPFTEGASYELMNFGVQGQAGFEEWADYERYARKYQPKVAVLTVYLGNDLTENYRLFGRREEILAASSSAAIPLNVADELTNFQQEHPRRDLKGLLLESRVLQTFLRFSKNNDVLFAWSVKLGLLNNPFVKDVGRSFNDVWLYTDPNDDAHMDVVRFSADLIKKTADAVKQDGGRLAVVIIPSHWQVDDRYKRRLDVFGKEIDFSVPTRVMKERLEGVVPVLDMTSRFEQAINQDHHEVYIRSRGHLTEKGSELVAQDIYRLLADHAGELGL